MTASNHQQLLPIVSDTVFKSVLVTQATVSFNVSTPSIDKQSFYIYLHCIDDALFGIIAPKIIILSSGKHKYFHTFTNLTSNHRYSIELHLYQRKTIHSKHKRCKSFKPIQLKLDTKDKLAFIISYECRHHSSISVYNKLGDDIFHLIEIFTKQLTFHHHPDLNVNDNGLTITSSTNRSKTCIILFGPYVDCKNKYIYRVKFCLEQVAFGEVGFGFITPEFEGFYMNENNNINNVCICYQFPEQHNQISSQFKGARLFQENVNLEGLFGQISYVIIEANMSDRIGSIYNSSYTEKEKEPVFTVKLPQCVAICVSIASKKYHKITATESGFF